MSDLLQITSGRRRMWRALRFSGWLSARDLAAIAAVPLPTAARYLRALHHGGLVRRLETQTAGVRWCLVRDFGPQLPRVPRGVDDV